MISDALDNLTIYSAVNPHVKTVIDFCANNDLQAQELGKTVIDGDDVFANFMKVPARAEEDGLLESHNTYIDIQVLLSGSESIGVTPRCYMDKSQGYDAEKDLEFWDDSVQYRIAMQPLEFAMFFPGDGHLPLIGSGELHKVVFKLKA